jgi:hypothetical protein
MASALIQCVIRTQVGWIAMDAREGDAVASMLTMASNLGENRRTRKAAGLHGSVTRNL